MPRFHIYYQYKGKPRTRVMTANNPPDELLMAMWKNLCLESVGQDFAITFRSEDAVLDRIRYRYHAGGRISHVNQGNVAVRPAKFAPGSVACKVPTSILLIMESPHFDEVNPCLQPLCPAAGETGERIHRFKDQLGRFLHQSCGNRLAHDTPLILCNPVPHPTSCRVSIGDAGWTWWKELVLHNMVHRVPKIRAWFRYRLGEYHPRVIINACTKLADTNPRTPNILWHNNGGHDFVARRGGSRRKGAPTCPKELVADMVRNYLERNRLAYRHSECVRTTGGFSETNIIQDCRQPSVFVFDLPHPVSWK